MNNCLSSRFEFYLDYKTPYDLNEVHNFYVRNMVLNVIVNKDDEPLEFKPTTNSINNFDFKWDMDNQICNECDIDV